MKESMSAHDLKGLKLIADLCIIEGILLVGSGVVLLVLGSLSAIFPVVAGILMMAMGYYLDDLRKIAWWGVIITNSLSLVGLLVGTLFSNIINQLPIGQTDFATLVINIPLSVLVIGYLLRSKVRSLFFEEPAIL